MDELEIKSNEIRRLQKVCRDQRAEFVLMLNDLGSQVTAYAMQQAEENKVMKLYDVLKLINDVSAQYKETL